MGEFVKNEQGLQGARRLLAYQLGMGLVIAAFAGIVSGAEAALSAMLGALISAVPNAIFAKKLFQYQGARAAKKIVNSFYQGEAIKLFLSIFLFSLVFIFFSVNPLVFFAAYIMTQMVLWFAPLIFTNNVEKTGK